MKGRCLVGGEVEYNVIEKYYVYRWKDCFGKRGVRNCGGSSRRSYGLIREVIMYFNFL